MCMGRILTNGSSTRRALRVQKEGRERRYQGSNDAFEEFLRIQPIHTSTHGCSPECTLWYGPPYSIGNSCFVLSVLPILAAFATLSQARALTHALHQEQTLQKRRLPRATSFICVSTLFSSLLLSSFFPLPSPSLSIYILVFYCH